MPRVRLANASQIRFFASEVNAVTSEMSLTNTPCEDIGVARRKLEVFSAFRDKAFKAFYARKILQLPPVIAAQVFDVSNGLISQAATSRNVYTAANALNSSSMELGVFNLPDGSRVDTPMNNDQRARIFRELTRMAIIKNRGVDVPNFQNRMVAGFLSEAGADAFRAGLGTEANIYRSCPEMQEGATSEPAQAEPAQADVNQGLEDSFRIETRRMLREVLGYTPDQADEIIRVLSDGIQIYGVTDNTLGDTIRVAVRGRSNRVAPSLTILRNRMITVLTGISEGETRVEMRSDGGYTVVIPESTNQSISGEEEFRRRVISAGYTSVVARRFIQEIYNQGLEINSRNAVGAILSSSIMFTTTLSRQGGGTPDPQLLTRYRTAFRNVFESFGYNRMDVSVQETNTGMVSLRIPVGSNATQEAEEGTPTRTLTYSRSTAGVQGMSEDNAAILALIAAGSDRDNAESLVTGLSSNNFNFTVRSRSGNVLSYRLQYFGSSENAPQSFVIKQLIESRLRLQSSDVTMGERQGDLVGEITFPSAQAETSAPRRNIFTDPLLANRVTNWFNRHGYANTYQAFYDAVSAIPTAQITVQDERPENLRITVRTNNRIETNQVPARDLKSTLAGPRDSENQRERYGQITYTLNDMRTEARFDILPFTGAQSATSTTTSPAQAAGNEQVEQLAREYGSVAAGPRIRGMFTREQYVQLRLAGYTYNQLRRFVTLLRERNLAVGGVQVKRTPRGAVRQFIQVNTAGGAGVPRAMRNQNYQSWLRGVLNRAEVQVSVNRDANQGPYLQMAGFRRGSGTGYFILPSLVGDSMPLLSRTDREEISRIESEQTGTSQSGQASQEIDPQGDPGQAGESNPTSSTAPPTRTRTRNVKLNRSIGIEIEGDMPFASEAGMSITDYFKLRMRQWCEANDQPRLKVGRGMDKYTFGSDGSVRGVVPFEVDSPALVPANIDPATTTLPPDFIRANKFESDAALWNQIRTFCESLQYSGVRIHKSAGLHIHISVADYTSEDFKRYIYNYASFEPLIDLAMAANSRGPGRAYSGSLVTEGRITTGYGRGGRVTRQTPEEAARNLSIGRKKIRTSTGIQTIEFRHPMTTIDYDDIKNFTLLHFYLVTVSKRKKLQRTNFKGLMNILPVEVATYFYNRIETMDMKSPTYNFFTGRQGQDSALQKAGDTSDGVRQANLPREDYT